MNRGFAFVFFLLLSLALVFLFAVKPDGIHRQLLLSDSNNNDPEQEQQEARRRLLADIDGDALARYKADPPGFRRHPSYYSDKYVRRAVRDDASMGSWTLVDNKRAVRPSDDFYAKYPHRDVPWQDFPPDTAWQKDTADYLPKFLDHGIALVERAMEAILTEYGLGKDSPDAASFEERIKRLGVKEGKNSPGGVTMYGDSYKGLVRRVLHAVVTEDTFVLAMSGHSSAAGHGNHFQQSYTHAYGSIVEPIFARLGVHSSSRNFGFGGLGTLQTGMATADLMGPDVDILMWDSSMTEKGSSAPGVLAIQGALGGERVPFFLGPGGRVSQLNSIAGMDGGVIDDGASSLKIPANTMEELENLPWASQCLNFGPDLKPVCGGNHYRGHCWIDTRSNFNWQNMNMSFVPVADQVAEPGGRASWHPGDRVHQIKGRIMAGIVLHALRDSLLLWKTAENYVLKDEDWHVGEYYQGIRHNITTVFKEIGSEWCTATQLPERFCQVPLQGRTEFTPRYDPANRNLRNLLKATRSTFIQKPAVYDPPDVYHPDLHPPEGSIDVLAIVENGVEFTPNLGRIRRRMTLPPVNKEHSQGGSSVNSKIVPGKGWGLNAVPTTNMCDGEYDSWCNRGEENRCLMYGHNDGRNGIMFDGLSGWGIFELPNVREGLIAVKFQSWHQPNANIATNGWTTENGEPAVDGRALHEENETVDNGRELKKKPQPFCEDFKFEYAIDGRVTSWSLAEWDANKINAQRVVEIAVLLDDPSYTGGESKNVELALKITGCKREKTFMLTHVYWA